jgi:hypothetical protein
VGPKPVLRRAWTIQWNAADRCIEFVWIAAVHRDQGISGAQEGAKSPAQETGSKRAVGTRHGCTGTTGGGHQTALLHTSGTSPPTGGSARRSHLPRRPHRQLQHLAQCTQVRIPWSAVIRLPEVNAGLADTDLISDFGNRKTTLDPSVAEMAAQTWFATQCTYSFPYLTRQHSCLAQRISDRQEAKLSIRGEKTAKRDQVRICSS